MEEIKLNFVLIGNARCGKTTTGNTILNKNVFNTSSRGASATSNVDFSSSQFGQYLLQGVDTPRIIDPLMFYKSSKTRYVNAVEQGLNFVDTEKVLEETQP